MGDSITYQDETSTTVPPLFLTNKKTDKHFVLSLPIILRFYHVKTINRCY